MQHPSSSTHSDLPSQAHTHTHTHHPTIEFPSTKPHPPNHFLLRHLHFDSLSNHHNLLLLSSPTRPILIRPRQPLFISRLGIRSLILCCSTSSRFENVGFVDVEIVFCCWGERGVSECVRDGWKREKNEEERGKRVGGFVRLCVKERERGRRRERDKYTYLIEHPNRRCFRPCILLLLLQWLLLLLCHL